MNPPTYSYVVNYESKWGDVTTNKDCLIEYHGERMTVQEVVKQFHQDHWDDDVVVSITELEHTTRSTEIWSRGA